VNTLLTQLRIDYIITDDLTSAEGAESEDQAYQEKFI